MALGPYAIVTLADLKALLGFTNTDTARDALLEQCIDRASSMVETVLGMGVIARDWVEWQDADGSRTVMLKNTPINSVSLVATDFVDALTVTATAGVTSGVASVSTTGITINWFDGTAQDSLSTTFAGNATIAAVVAALLPDGATLATVRNGPSNQLVPGAYDFTMSDVTMSMAVSDGTRWRVDGTTGELTIACSDYASWSDYDPADAPRTGFGGPSGSNRVCVKYNAGWALASVPYDIVQATLGVARSLYLGRATDDTKQSESLGDYSVSYRSEASLASLYTGLRESLAGRMVLR